MKRSFIKSTLLLAFAAVMVSSCSKDDDEGGVTSYGISRNIPASVKDGVRISQVGTDRLYYDDNGMLTKVETYDGQWEIGKNLSSVSCKRGNESYKYNMAFDSNGFVTQMDGVRNVREGNETTKTTGTITLSYDGKGRFIGAKSNINETWSEGKDSGTGQKNRTMTLSYSGNAISKIVVKDTWSEEFTEDGRRYKESGTYSELYEFSGSTQKNKYGLYDAATVPYMFDGDFRILAYAGYMGLYSTELPATIKVKTVESNPTGKDYVDNRTVNPRYSFNSDGTIKTAGGYYYSYTTTLPSSRAAEPCVASECENKSAKGLFGMSFRHGHSRK